MKGTSLLVLLALSAFFGSCSQSQLSCDPDINLWAKSHLLEFSHANRPSIVALPLGRQMAIYNGFSSAKKAELWRAKLSI